MSDSRGLQRTFRLGDPGPSARVTVLRDGALRFEGRRGVRPAWKVLIEALPPRARGEVLVARDPAGVLTLAATALWPDVRVTTHQMDAWDARIAARSLDANEVPTDGLVLAGDLPPGPFSLVAIPFPARAEALAGRELIEAAHDALSVGGRLLASTDGSPRWLRKVVKEVFGKSDLQVTGDSGSVVTARRTREDPRRRDHDHVIKVGRGDRELALLTRPGVFSPGRLDGGARALLSAFAAKPGERVLDIGCGIGVLGLAAAVDSGPKGVVLVDSNARATETARRNADTNGLGAVEVVIRADLEDLPGAPFDRVVANPPYYAEGRIADAFARTAATTLTPDGTLHMVAKAIPMHGEILDRWFDDVEVDEVRGYGVFHARRPRRSPAERVSTR